MRSKEGDPDNDTSSLLRLDVGGKPNENIRIRITHNKHYRKYEPIGARGDNMSAYLCRLCSPLPNERPCADVRL